MGTKMSGEVVIGDKCPTLEDLWKIIKGEKIVVLGEPLEKLDRSRSAYLRAIEEGKRVYGYCTGLGELYRKSPAKCDSKWEKHVLLEHAMGLGNPAPKILSRAFLVVRLSQLLRGRAPVRGKVAERIVEALNHDITPLIPVHGSVGASGDLAPSAHAFLCLYYGEGLAYTTSGNGFINCQEALNKSGLEPLTLEAGEALALINNTAWSTALALVSWYAMKILIEEGLSIARRSLELSRCVAEHYDPILSEASGYPEMKEILSSLNPKCPGADRLQDPYSLRCIPQIFVALKRIHSFLEKTIQSELCSSTENPVIVEDRVLHWCGFHSVNISLAMDYARIALGTYANLLERRIAQLLRKDINGISDFLSGRDDSVGAMITQYTAAALNAYVRALSQPLSVHSIPTSGYQEDVVPMSPESGILLVKSLKAIAMLTGIEDALVAYASSRMKGGVEELRKLLTTRVNDILEKSVLNELSIFG